jgi:hypothetical protein
MRKTDRRTAQEQSRQAQLRLPLRELVREALFDTVIVSVCSTSVKCWKRSAPRSADHVISMIGSGGRCGQVRCRVH